MRGRSPRNHADAAIAKSATILSLPRCHSAALAEFLGLEEYGVKHSFGALGQHGIITVTERVIGVLKCEWLRGVAAIRGGYNDEGYRRLAEAGGVDS